MLGKEERPFIELENPEWPVVLRKARLSFIASQIAASVALRRVPEGKLAKTKNLGRLFNFKAFRDDVLLLNDARELNGQCEYFISFAFLAPRSIKSRRCDGGFWGPLYAIRGPFVSPGGLVRELILSALLWLATIGLALFWYTPHLGLVYWTASGALVIIPLTRAVYWTAGGILIVVGLTGTLALKRGAED